MKIRACLMLYLMLSVMGIGKAAAQPYIQTLDIRVRHFPEIVVIDGKPTVSYELHLVNFANISMEITGLTVVEEVSGKHVFSITNDDLKHRHKMTGTWETPPEGLLPPGSGSVVYMDFTLPSGLKSKKLRHQFHFLAKSGVGDDSVLVAAPVIELRETTVVLGAPLQGGPWAAIHEPTWERGHRRMFYTVDGKASIPGRFAIDFMLLDDAGKLAKGDDDQIANWYGYGLDVLAVAAGTVVSCNNDFPESPTLSGHPRYPAEKATGNYVCLKIDSGQYVFYEHLKPGSLRVKAGQQVAKGEVIASLGFTGQTSGPHLHFHVADKPSPLGAEGLSFVFEQFDSLGGYPDFGKLGRAPWIPPSDNRQLPITNERPGPNTVIHFK